MLGPAVVQYSFKLLSNLVSRVLSYSHLFQVLLGEERGGGGDVPSLWMWNMVVSHFEE